MRTVQVLARRQSTVGSIVVQESPLDNPPAELVERCLLDAVRRVGVARLLPWPKAAVSWRQRLQWVRRRPGAPDLPDLSVRLFIFSLKTARRRASTGCQRGGKP
jgi:hypothetical protein